MQESPVPLYPTIHAEIANLQDQIKQIDLPAKITRESLARSQYDKCVTGNPPSLSNESNINETRRRLSELQNAQGDLAESKRTAAALTRDVDRLAALLDADNRAAQAQLQIVTATDPITTAQSSFDAAQTAQAEINRMVDEETQILTSSRISAGSTLLEQVKAGKPGKLPSVSRERLDTLMLAQAAANIEVTAALETLAQYASDLESANAELAHANADITERTLHLMTADYAHALNAHKATAAMCGRQFNAPDVDQLARQFERATQISESDANPSYVLAQALD